MKKILLVTLFMVFNLFGQEPMLRETPFAEVLQQIGKHKRTFIEVGSDTCRSCQVMGRKLYVIKQKHPEYPIYFVNVHKEREAAYRLRVQMIPTQIVVDSQGNEIYRHVGILEAQEIKKFFN
ncbi:thioredoxin family protein [Sulfurimonas paralvinellae]|uniref:Thioredoxin family protein n=1 Tax=Sulfurimonas paralvinellae TaxID=317658 RepID=A0A7M1B7X0_9BACT|nr:thioredoxin family protein [Sulfurimonas paralvinellae]QOP45800.1 thioredoxin family protein [Sulfurimonas paralvinellae]